MRTLALVSRSSVIVFVNPLTDDIVSDTRSMFLPGTCRRRLVYIYDGSSKHRACSCCAPRPLRGAPTRSPRVMQPLGGRNRRCTSRGPWEGDCESKRQSGAGSAAVLLRSVGGAQSL